MQGEAISVDVEVPTSHPEDLPKRINEGGDTEQQIFNVDETDLHCRKMPSRTYREEKSMPGSKASKDSLTFMLGANATGTFH